MYLRLCLWKFHRSRLTRSLVDDEATLYHNIGISTSRPSLDRIVSARGEDDDRQATLSSQHGRDTFRQELLLHRIIFENRSKDFKPHCQRTRGPHAATRCCHDFELWNFVARTQSKHITPQSPHKVTYKSRHLLGGCACRFG